MVYLEQFPQRHRFRTLSRFLSLSLPLSILAFIISCTCSGHLRFALASLLAAISRLGRFPRARDARETQTFPRNSQVHVSPVIETSDKISIEIELISILFLSGIRVLKRALEIPETVEDDVSCLYVTCVLQVAQSLINTNITFLLRIGSAGGKYLDLQASYSILKRDDDPLARCSRQKRISRHKS